MALIFDLAAQVLQMLLVLAIAPLVLGVTRKVKARLLRRIGPPIVQPYRDLWKLLHKEAVLAHNASWLYRVVPYTLFAVTWVAAALVPTYSTGLMFSWSADLIAIVALLATGRFALALGRYGCRHRVRRHRLLARDDGRFAGRARDAAGRLYRGSGRGHDAIVVDRRHLQRRAGRLAGFAWARAVRVRFHRHCRECPHPDRQSRDPSRADHGA